MSQSVKEQLKLLGFKGSDAKPAPTQKRNQTLKYKKTVDHSKIHRKKTKSTYIKSQKIKTADTSASAFSSQTMRDAYGSKSKTKPTKPVDKPLIEFPASLDNSWKHSQGLSELVLPRTDGIKQSLGWAGDYEETDQINVGFDFGTSAIKVMLRSSDENLLPVKFTSNANNPYVLPSCLYVANGNASLQKTPRAEAYQNLKLPLLEDGKSEQDIVRAATFIALALRLVRGWLFDNYSDVYGGKFLVWELNFGVPAVVDDNKEKMDSFKDLFELAYFASTQDNVQIDLGTVTEFWRNRAWESKNISQTLQHQLHVVPEIAAQFWAVFKSDSWDQSKRLMSVVDIGAGTVDIGVFSITGKNDTQKLHSLKTNVEPNGVVNLHRHRIQKMLQIGSNADDAVKGYLNGLLQISDVNKPIPDKWIDYLPGSQLIQGYFDPDHSFDSEIYSPQVMGVLKFAKKERYPNPEEWKSLSVLVCGGGGSTELFHRLYERHSSTRVTQSIGLKVVPLITPLKVRDSGLTDLTYKRMSLAYGLSFSFDLFPKFVRESDISDFKQLSRSIRVEMITKDSV